MTTTIKYPHLYHTVERTHEGQAFTIYSRKDQSSHYVIIKDDYGKLAYAGVNIGAYGESHPFAYTINLANVQQEGLKVLGLDRCAKNIKRAINGACDVLLTQQAKHEKKINRKNSMYDYVESLTPKKSYSQGIEVINALTKGRRHEKVTMYYREEYFSITMPNGTSYRVQISDSPAFSNYDAFVVPCDYVFRVITSKGKELRCVENLYNAILLACDLVLSETGISERLVEE